jgi:alanyl-tRNA synthetase
MANTFKNALGYLTEKLDISINNEIWEKFGPYSCTLNIDEVDDVDKAWQEISDKIGINVDILKQAIQPVKELYIILDHTRTILFTISDGALPSNVGGGGNVRNILRRCFSLLKKNGWWDILGMDGFFGNF